MFAVRSISPLKICNLGFFDHTRLFLKKININDSVKKTVKKYLPQVICKTGNDQLKYLAKASITGTIIHADKLINIAFIKKNILER